AEAPFFAGYLIPEPYTLLDYLPGALVVLDEPRGVDEALGELDGQSRELEGKLTASGAIPAGFRAPALGRDALLARFRQAATLTFSYRPAEAPLLETHFSEEERAEARIAPEGAVVIGSFDMAPTFGGRIKDVIDATRARAAARQRVVLVSQQAGRLHELYV